MTESGVIPRSEDRGPCRTCLGLGVIEVDHGEGTGPVVTEPCPDCQEGSTDG